MPDVIQIGQHAYALTLNLILTGCIGLFFSLALFYWSRKVKKEDEIKKALIQAREDSDAERHRLILESVKEIKEELGDKSDTIFQKVDDYCKANSAEHGRMKRNFWKHRHDNGSIIIPEYEP